MGGPVEALKWVVSHSDDGTLPRDREPVALGLERGQARA